MSGKNVVRQDVVQITWDVASSPFGKITKEVNEFHSTAGKAFGNTESKFNKFSKSMSKGWDNTVKGANKLKASLTPLDNKLNKLGNSAVKVGKKFASSLGKTAKRAVLGLAGAVGTLGTLSVKGYAEYEQLIGGVETLFKGDAGGVIENANKAYKTAGLSANAYMDTVTSFSASLLQSLNGDTKKATSVADRAIIDMSDNANKMGTDMSSIQYAYQGFAKQNYTMLDNLKLGYGGTKEEMERLVKEASQMTDVQKKLGVTVDGSSLSFANIINAISVVQEKMGITGTTSEEAATTIQGSISSMKGAWTNFMVGMADPSQDFDVLLKNLIDSVITVGKNLIPRIGIVLKQTVQELAPAIGQGLLKLKEYLIANKEVIWSGFKEIMAQGINLVYKLFTGESLDIESLKSKIQSVTDKVIGFVTIIKDNMPLVKATIIGVVGAIALLKGTMFACNAIIAINNGLMKAKQAIDLLCIAKTKAVAAAQWIVNTSFLGCPIVWIVAGILAVIAVFILLVKNWDKVKEAAVKCWGKIRNTWANVSSWFSSKIVTPIKKGFSGLWDGICDGANAALDKVKTAWGGIKDWFADIWKQTVKNVATPVNKIIGGANWVLEKVGSDKKIDEWQPYARGTAGHPGGNAIVNDGSGAELVQFPNGKMFIPSGRNVLLPNAPRGMRVLNAENTARLMGRKSPTFHYEDGAGFSVWDFFSKPSELVGKVIDKFVSFKNMSGYALDVGKGMVNTAKTAMVDWVKGLFNSSGGKDIGSYVPSKGVEQWRSVVEQALKMENLFSAANVKRTLYQMQTESGGNPKAINNWDSNARRGTPSKGLMQVIDPTFKAYARKGYSSNIYHPLSNVLASVRYAKSRYGSLAKAYRGVGYAGGIGLPYYDPSSSISAYRGGNTNNNNYSPSFTLNMSGTVDRTTERTVKKWVKEAIEDTIDSMSRTSPRLQEV